MGMALAFDALQALEDRDGVARADLDDGLLPPSRAPPGEAAALGLGLDDERAHVEHLDVEQLLNRLADLGFVRVGVYPEGVAIGGREHVALLGHHGTDEHLGGLHVSRPFRRRSWRARAPWPGRGPRPPAPCPWRARRARPDPGGRTAARRRRRCRPPPRRARPPHSPGPGCERTGRRWPPRRRAPPAGAGIRPSRAAAWRRSWPTAARPRRRDRARPASRARGAARARGAGQRGAAAC